MTKHDDVVDQLDRFYEQAKRQILQYQSAITGLFPSNSLENSNASIKTSLWAASSIFALYLAYSKRVDHDQGKAHDLGQSVVKCMRGILFAWMRQSENVESFKANQCPKHALHSKFDLHSGLANDPDYPHLQIDVVSLYLIFLSNFIASGLDIIYCMDEVTFIQNLVYYVERAYRTPDYGNWEPSSSQEIPHEATGFGVNQNHPNNSNFNAYTNNYHQRYTNNETQRSANSINNNDSSSNPQDQQRTENLFFTPDGRSLEIHATSIGMAKSALEAINGCNLFGGKGANWSIVYSDIDAHSRNRSIFETLLPRESRSKNTDSYLLAAISWPCFAIHDQRLYIATKQKIIRRLRGKYGFKRFLRDPYGTVIESNSFDRQSYGLRSNITTPDSPIDMTTSGQQQSQSNNSQQTEQHQHSGSSQMDDNFSSLTSLNSQTASSSVEPPKTKQRKSSYFQRRNTFILANQTHSLQDCDSCTSQRILQRVDSATLMSKRFENIECEWPLFVCFLIIDGIFKQDPEQVNEYEKLLYERLLKMEPKHNDYLMPKYYYVPFDKINTEKCHPDSVDRLPSPEGSTSEQLYLTGQSILLITRLLLAKLVHPHELDPLRRYMPSHDRPKRIGRYSSFRGVSSNLVVQTVLIAESIRLQAMMANYGIQTQTPLEVEPVQIWSSSQLVKVYEYLGINEKLGLRGRPSRPIGALGTSKLYRICGQTILCYPLIFEVSDFYLAQDMLLLIDDIQNELNFIGNYWRMAGRPTVCIIIREEHLKDVHFRDLLDLLVQFKNGQLKKSGLRIKTGRLQNLINSSCIEHLDFLHLLPHDHLPQFKSFRQLVECPKESLLTMTQHDQSTNYAYLDSSNGNNYKQSNNMNSSTSTGNRAAPKSDNYSSSSSSNQHYQNRSRRLLCSASSNNLQAIDELNASVISDEDPEASNDYPQRQGSIMALELASAQGYKPNSNDLDESFSTEPSASIDYYECFKEAPTRPTLIETLKTCTEIGGQSQLLAILWEREGAKFCIDNMTVEERLESLSQRACELRNWSVVRYCSAVLKRSVESLSPWLTSILVSGKQISLGSGNNENIINNPLTPTEIHNLIYSSVSTNNPCDAVLQQEIALYIGRLISTRPDYFDGILTIRVINFMSAMRSYLNIKTNEQIKELSEKRMRANQLMGDQMESSDESQHFEPSSGHNVLLDLSIKPNEPDNHEQQGKHNSCKPTDSNVKLESDATGAQRVDAAVSISSQAKRSKLALRHQDSSGNSKRAINLVAKPLESLSPSDVRKLLVKVLKEVESLSISDRRQITGELCRVPKDFYDKVWSLLGCTSVGIVIGGKLLRSIPILSNMTQDDLNFALKVESLLSAIQCPKLRQINVEMLMSLHIMVERNPEIRFESDPLDLDKIIRLSLEKFRSDHGREQLGLDEFYTHPDHITSLYTMRTVFDCLMPERYKACSSCDSIEPN